MRLSLLFGTQTAYSKPGKRTGGGLAVTVTVAASRLQVR